MVHLVRPNTELIVRNHVQVRHTYSQSSIIPYLLAYKEQLVRKCILLQLWNSLIYYQVTACVVRRANSGALINYNDLTLDKYVGNRSPKKWNLG